MQPTALQLGILALTSPNLLWRSHRAARRLSRSESPDAVLPLLHVCDTLSASPSEPAGHDPIDEAQRLVRRARQSRAARLRNLSARAYTRLSEDAKRELRHRSLGDIPRLVAALARSDQELARRSAIDLASDALDARQIPSLLTLVEDASEEVAGAARRTIRDLARHHAEHAQSPVDSRTAALLLASADRFPEHRSSEIMQAAILILDPITLRRQAEERADSWLEGRDEAVLMGLRAALTRTPGPIGRLRAWELLSAPTMRKAAIDRLTTQPMPGELAPLLALAHLGVRAARREPLRSRVSRAQRPALAPDADEIESFPVPARRGLTHWLTAIGAEGEVLDELLEPMLVEGDALARFSAMRLAPAPLVRDFAFDPNRAIASSACLKLVHTYPEELTPKLRQTLQRSRHAGVRELVRERQLLSRDTLRARRLIADDRTNTLDGLRLAIESGDERETLGAVHVIRRLGVAEELSEALIRALERAFRQDDSPAWRVISSILTLLPDLPHPSVAKLLAAARSHHDARVRANAVEAEPRRPRGRSSSMFELIEPALDDPHHRVRTSAMRVLLNENAPPADSVDRVLKTLGETESAPRAAALWLVERSVTKLRPHAGRRWSDVAARIAEIARTSPEDAERARATRCARRMLAEMKA